MTEITVGLVMPATNTTLEPELRAWFPCPIRLSVQRITRPKGVLRPEDLPEERERVAAAGQALRAQKPDVVVMGCTAAGFLAGPAGDRDFCSDLQQITGVPTVSAAGSMLAALRSSSAPLGVKGVGQMTQTPAVSAVRLWVAAAVSIGGLLLGWRRN